MAGSNDETTIATIIELHESNDESKDKSKHVKTSTITITQTPDGCCDRCKHFYTKINPYLKIFIAGIVYGTAISVLYSWMSDVNELQLTPDENHSIFSHDESFSYSKIENGLFCYVVDTGSNDQQYCNDMTDQLINITESNSSITTWQCDLYADYSNKALYDDLPLFRNMLILFFICTGLSTIYSIIHDWTLVYHRKDLSKLVSYPHHKQDIARTDVDIPIRMLVGLCGNCHRYCIIFWCILPASVVILIQLILIILQFAWMITFYPFYIMFTNCDCTFMCCKGFSYVSSAVVGLSSGLMMASAVVLLFATSAIDRDVPSLDEDKCECSCEYILIEDDLWSFIIVAFGLAISNINFLWKWYGESVHGEQFLYLIRYDLPLFRATHINDDDDPVGSMFGNDPKQIDHVQIEDVADDTRELNYVQMDDVAAVENNQQGYVNVNTMKMLTAGCRLIWVMVIIFVSWEYLSIQMMIFGGTNVYDYAPWIAILIFSGGVICCCGLLVTWCGMYIWSRRD